MPWDEAGVTLDSSQLTISLGEFVLLDHGQPKEFDRIAAHTYLKQCSDLSSQAVAQQILQSTAQANDLITTDEEALKRNAIAAEALAHPVKIAIGVGNEAGTGKAWGCDLSYDYVKINAEYTT